MIIFQEITVFKCVKNLNLRNDQRKYKLMVISRGNLIFNNLLNQKKKTTKIIVDK